MLLTEVINEPSAGSVRRREEHNARVAEIMARADQYEADLAVAEKELDNAYETKDAAAIEAGREKVYRLEQAIKLIGGELNTSSGVMVWGGVNATKNRMLHGTEDK